MLIMPTFPQLMILMIQYYPIGRWESQDSSVSIDMGWMAIIPFPVGERDISLLHTIQMSYGAHPACYPRSLFPGGKAAGM
jgi:hypothetical protein